MFPLSHLGNWELKMQPTTLASPKTEREWMPSLQSSRWIVSWELLLLNSRHWPWFTVPPDWITKPKDVIKVTEGSTVTVECVARGEPEPSVTIAKKHGMTSHLLILPNEKLSFAYSSFCISSFDIRVWMEESWFTSRKVHDSGVKKWCWLLPVSSRQRHRTSHSKRLRTRSFRY